MKQLKPLILVLAAWLTVNLFAQSTHPLDNLDKTTEAQYWEFLKERLYNQEIQSFSKIQTDEITILLDDATKEDSTIVNNLITQLQKIIPNRTIRLTNRRRIKDHISFWLYFPLTNNELLTNLNSSDAERDQITHSYSCYFKLLNFDDKYDNKIQYPGYNGENQSKINTQHILFTFSDSSPYDVRRQYIEYAILRSMCTFNGNREEIKTHIDTAVFNSFDFNPVGTTFTERDKFLIHKLYSDDFEVQFRTYITKAYSWYTYWEPYIVTFLQHFTYETIAYGVLFILIILLYKPIFNRRYKKAILGYLVPAITLAALCFIVFGIIEFPKMLLGASQSKLSNYLLMIPSVALFFIFVFSLFSILVYGVECFIIPKLSSFCKPLLFKVFSIPVLLVLSVMVSGYLSLYVFDVQLYTIRMLGAMLVIGLAISVARVLFLYLRNLSEMQLRVKESEISLLKEQKAKAELQSLHSRINPHFLYNSLNTIAGLAHNNPAKTEKMALALSDFFRYTINRNQTQLSTIKEELEMAETYLEIEKIRFGERMSYQIDIDDTLLEVKIPRFIVQPLVENAIKHGISNINGNGEIAIFISKIAEKIELKITDNGPAFEDGLVSGYGLQSVYDILKLSYGDAAEMSWKNDPKKSITVSFPIN